MTDAPARDRGGDASLAACRRVCVVQDRVTAAGAQQYVDAAARRARGARRTQSPSTRSCGRRSSGRCGRGCCGAASCWSPVWAWRGAVGAGPAMNNGADLRLEPRGARSPPPPIVMLNDETLRDGLQSPSVRAPDHRPEAAASCTCSIASASTPPTSACPAPVRTSSRTSSGWRARSSTAEAQGAAPTARRGRSIADIQPIADIVAAHRAADRVLLLHRLQSDPPLRRGLDGRLPAALHRGGGRRSRVQAGPDGDVRHRRHDAVGSRDAAPAVHGGDPRRRVAHLHRRHGRARDAGRRARRRPLSRGGSSRSTAATSASTGTATATATWGRSTASPRSRPGATRVHGTILGIGERVGNTPMDLLMVNLVLMGWIERDLTQSERSGAARCRRRPASRFPTTIRCSAATRSAPRPASTPPPSSRRSARTIPSSRTRSIRACRRGWSGASQQIEIGPMSGKSNVVFWLERRGFAPRKRWSTASSAAPRRRTVLTEQEILHEIDAAQTYASTRLDA